MNKLLLITAALCAFAAPAFAGNVSYDSYSTPDTQAFNDVTTTADGASDTPYSYYTGPVVFALSGGGSITAYCVDLNHYLQNSGLFTTGILDHNGEGQLISKFNSNRIGNIALLGAAALAAGGTANLDKAAAAQEAIWDIAYGSDHPSFSTSDGTIEADIYGYLGESFAMLGYANALIPVGDNQMMVTGFAGSVPEPSTWAMGLMGFAGIAGLSLLKRRQTARYIEA